MEIVRGSTLSGFTINAVEGEYVLTISQDGSVCIADSVGEVIVDSTIIPKVDIYNLNDNEIRTIFHKAVHYLNFIKTYQDDLVVKNHEDEIENDTDF